MILDLSKVPHLPLNLSTCQWKVKGFFPFQLKCFGSSLSVSRNLELGIHVPVVSFRFHFPDCVSYTFNSSQKDTALCRSA